MKKLQTTVEFIHIATFLVIIALIVSALYFGYINKSIQTETISDPNYIQSFYPLNSTSSLLSSTQPLVKNFNIIFTFTINGIKENESINYVLYKNFTNQYGTKTYEININGNPVYNPFIDTNYEICSINYENNSKLYSIIVNQTC